MSDLWNRYKGESEMRFKNFDGDEIVLKVLVRDKLDFSNLMDSKDNEETKMNKLLNFYTKIIQRSYPEVPEEYARNMAIAESGLISNEMLIFFGLMKREEVEAKRKRLLGLEDIKKKDNEK